MNSKRLNQMVFLLGLMAFWCNGDNYAAAPLLIDIARDLHLDISKAAISVIAYMLCFGLFTIIFGPLGDRYGKTKIINIAAFGTAIFSCLGATAFNLTSLSIYRAINGAFAAGVFPVTMALIGESFDDSSRQNAIGKVMGMMFLGGASATAIGGLLAYLGSWRLVYLVYGVAELIVASVLLKALEQRSGVISSLSFGKVYGQVFANKNLIKVVTTIFLVGYCVFGSFTYSGKFVQARTGYNILMVGLILTFFGIASVIGGRKAGTLRQKLGNKFLLLAGILGGASLATLSFWYSPVLISISLFGFGLAFIFFQSTLVTAAQQLMPKLRGTVMSLASFNMFVGGGIGTLLNGYILNKWGISMIFVSASLIMFLVGFVATRIITSIQQNLKFEEQLRR